MMKIAASAEDAEASAAAAIQQREEDIETIFNSLDLDRGGTLNQTDFLSLRETACPNMSKQELRAIFREKDLDSSGTIDLEEFRQLCADFPGLLEHKEAICKHSTAARNEKATTERQKDDLWKLGLPNKVVAARAGTQHIDLESENPTN